MPQFTYDLSDVAINYVKESIKDMPGNSGQEVLVEDLEYYCNAELVVYIAGDFVDSVLGGDLVLRSNHPEAIEIIMEKAQEHFEEFRDAMNKESFFAYSGLNILETIRQNYIDEAFGDLG